MSANWKRGQAHPKAKLTDYQVRELRAKYHEWQMKKLNLGYQKLAQMYGVSMWTIRDIVTYRTRVDA